MSQEQLPVIEGSEEPKLKQLVSQEQSFLKRFAHSRLAQGLMFVTALVVGEHLAEARPVHPAGKSNRPVPAHKIKLPPKSPPKPSLPKNKAPQLKHPKLQDAPLMEGTRVASLNAWNDQGMKREIAAAEHFGLQNFKTEDDLRRALEKGALVELKPGSEDGYMVDEGLGEKAPKESRHLYAALTPKAAEWFTAFAQKFQQKFGKKLLLSSAVRTEKYVDAMRRGNPNVAKAYTSSHLKGTTLDFKYYSHPTKTQAEYQLTLAQQKWVSDQLLTLEGQGLAQATKETGQPVFHVMIHPDQKL